MKLTLNINYWTNWGENLWAVLLTPEVQSVPLTLEGAEHWRAQIEIPEDKEGFTKIDYRYEVRNDNMPAKTEWGKARHLETRTSSVECFDRWQDRPWDEPYYASAFTDSICRRISKSDSSQSMPAKGFATFEVSAPMLQPDWRVAICGEAEQLGGWDTTKAIPMSDALYPVWSANVKAEGLEEGSLYKFLIIDSKGEVVAWENGDNRRLDSTPAAGTATVFAGMRLINPLGLWRGAGTAIPVFSLRSDEDFGVGDFADINAMIDWCKATGQKFLQILPINDTTMTHTWQDSYPYNANSCFALHPMYLRLEQLGVLADRKRRAYFENLKIELNALDKIDYERVNAAKIEYFKEIFEQEGARTIALPEYKEFVERNHDWLMPYAAFCVLRDRFNTPVFSNWGEYAEYDKDKIEAFIEANRKEIDYVCYLQYHLDKQMRQVHEYAKANGIAIKGDIPIGISRDSVDAWIYPRLFHMDCQAGAPPDDFSVLGQNWGFPTYNWEEMSKDGFAWWKARFTKMSEYFDAYRIDHVLGFFRIWQIPYKHLHGLLGIFNPALPMSEEEMRNNFDFWIDVDLYTTPYIMDSFLHDFFGPYTDEARKTFMYSVGYGRYKLKDPFTTQRAVAEYFETLEKDEKNTRLCNGLLGLIDQVLFIEDPTEPGKFHPRISAQYTYTYRALNDYEKWCFDRLYNDFFYHRHNDFWYGKAMWKLPALIDSNPMLTCAEDLGMIPACVPAVLSQLEILTLEIQRMPKDPTTPFGNTWSYPYYSVCTTSTHDMGGIRAWWEDDRRRSADYYRQVLHLEGEPPYFAEPWLCEKILMLNSQSPSMLCIIPLADWLSMDGDIRRKNPADELINIPANPRHYWRYRMHLTIGELQKATGFNDKLKKLIKESNR